MTDTKVYMNLGIPDAIEKYKDLPFDGIGLMRIEFIIASSIKTHPLKLIKDEDQEIYIEKLMAGIRKVAETVHPKPVVVRFSDLKTNEYRKLKGGMDYEIEEKNPWLGLRGASRYISERYGKVFRLEYKAIKMLRKDLRNVWVMIPFIRTTWEAQRCLKIMEDEGLNRSKDFKVWLMAEVPSLSFIIDEFNKLPIDGYSIGSNDLCQFVLGVDRDSTVLAKMGYFNERDPAVIKAMEMIVKGAKRGGKTCSICGESVSNYEEVIKKLVDSGIDSISVNPDVVEKSKKFIEKVKGKK